MSEIRKWVEAIGLGQYAEAFEANDIDMDLLKQVNDQSVGIAASANQKSRTLAFVCVT
jgi:hypothetical protein